MADVDITSLSVEISAESSGAELNINKLATAISNLRTKSNVTKVVNGLDKLSASISALKQASSGLDGLDKLQSFLDGLGNLDVSGSAKSLNSVVNAIKKIPTAVSNLNGVDFYSMSDSMTQLMNALAPLSILDVSGLKAIGSAINAIGKVPDLSDKLKAADLDSFTESCQKISAALTPLASQLEKVGNAFAKMPAQLGKVVTQANRVAAANQKTSKSYMSLSAQMSSFMKRAAQLVSLKAIATYIGNAIVKFNDFYEATDLFNNAMGNLSDEASSLVSKMQELLGIDPKDAMEHIATIQSLATSFGLASDKAYILSKNLTQLAYDEASYWNKDSAETFTAISSAISGELEPIRRLGVDLSQARLQQELLALGFNKQVSSLSQADKAVLRYIAIMKQTTNIQGNLAQTITSPANQIRMLKAELDQLAKSVGSLLYPALSSILPPLIAAVELIKEFVQWVAKLMGIDIKFTDFSKVQSDVGGVSDALDDTADSTKKAAKALKDYTMGFDELNIIDPTQGSGSSGSGSGSSGNILGDVDLSGYDMFKDYVGNSVDEIKAKFESLKGVIAAIGISLAGLGMAKFIKDIGDAVSKMGILEKTMASIATFTIEAVLVYKFEKNYAETGNIADLILSWATTGIASYIGYKAWGPGGAIVGLTISYVMTLKAQADALSSGKESFGDASTWISILNQGLKGMAIALGVSVLTPFAVGASAAALTGFSIGALISFEVGLASVKDKLSQYPIMEEITRIVERVLVGGVVAGAALLLGATAGVAAVAATATVGVLIGFNLLFGKTKKDKESEVDALSGADEAVDESLAKFEMSAGKRIEETKKWWSDKWDGFKSNIATSWDSLTSFAENYWENESLLHGLIEQTQTNISELKNSLDAIKSAFEEKVQNISQSAAEAGKAAAEWVNNVLKSFTDKRDAFFDAGKNLIQGFIDGLKKLKDDAVNSVKNIASNVTDAFKNLLGIHSPSKVFEQFGEYIDQGLANGIIGALGYVQAAATQLAGAVTENGNQLINAGYTSASNYVTNFLNGLDTQWEQIDSSLQNDFLGSVQTLSNAIKNGDLETLGKWSASYFYHAMDDEQKKQILSIANGALSQLKSSLSGVWQNIAGMASSFIGQLVPATTAATTSQVGLNVAMDANPIMLVISLIGMLVGFLINLAGTNSDVAGAMGKVWKGLSNVMSFVFENIIRWLGLFIDGFIMSINVVIRAYNAIARLWGGNEIGYISNPLFEYADQIAASRKASNSASDTVDSIDKTQVPGTSEYEQATGSGSVGSYASSSSGGNGLSEEEFRRAVYNGTYNAFLDIYQRYEGQDNTPTFKIYLDGRQITSTVEKTQSERGVSIMGREVYSY